MGSRAARIRTSTHMGSRHVQGEDKALDPWHQTFIYQGSYRIKQELLSLCMEPIICFYTLVWNSLALYIPPSVLIHMLSTQLFPYKSCPVSYTKGIHLVVLIRILSSQSHKWHPYSCSHTNVILSIVILCPLTF